MMRDRLLEIRKLLSPDGSIYVHCDTTESHYLKVVMDELFGRENFRSEVIWKRTSAHSSAQRYGPVHETILFYSKSERDGPLLSSRSPRSSAKARAPGPTFVEALDAQTPAS